jgi:hypothetical protein
MSNAVNRKEFLVELTPDGVLRAIKYFQDLYMIMTSPEADPNIKILSNFLNNCCLFSYNLINKSEYFVTASSLLSAFNAYSNIVINPRSFSHLMDNLMGLYPHLNIIKKRSSSGYRYIGITLSHSPTTLSN